MARYSASRVSRTLTLHKDDCQEARKVSVSDCGCGSTPSRQGDTAWFCEGHVTIDAVTYFIGERRFWAILLCGKCYGIE